MLGRTIFLGTMGVMALVWMPLQAADGVPTTQPATQSTTQPAADPNVPGTFSRIPLTSLESGHYLCPAVVDKLEIPFLVDSGALGVVIDIEVAKKLNKTLTPAQDGTAANRVAKFFKAHFDEVRIARTIRVANQNLVVTDFAATGKLIDNGKDVEYGGAVGCTPLMQLGGVLDYPRSLLLFPKLNISNNAYSEFAQQKGWRSVKLVHDKANSYVFAPMTINGKQYVFLVDSGAGINTVQPQVVKEMKLDRIMFMKNGKIEPGQPDIYHVKDAQLGGRQIGPLTVRTLESHVQKYVPEGHVLGGILGTRTLKGLNAKVDFGSAQIFFEETPTKSSTTP